MLTKNEIYNLDLHLDLSITTKMIISNQIVIFTNLC